MTLSLSLQDTVVSLQALAQYAALIPQEIRDVKVTVKGKAASPLEFHVHRNNKLVLHQASLRGVPGTYTVQATGSGCVYVQVSTYKEQSCQVLPLTLQMRFGSKQALQPQILSKIWLPRQNHVKFKGGQAYSVDMALLQPSMVSSQKCLSFAIPSYRDM